MKKIKLLFILYFCLMLTGCTVDYNITINEDLSMDEEAIIEVKESYFNNYLFYTKEEVYNAFLSRHVSFLNKHNYEYEPGEDYLKTTLNNSYDKISDYINDNDIYQQFFENLNYSEENNIVTIKSSGDFFHYTEDNAEKFLIENIDINIRIPFDVIASNADKVNSSVGLYTWTITKEDMNKEFFLQFDYSDMAFEIKYGDYIPFVIVGSIIVLGIICVYAKIQIDRRKNNII